MIIKANAKINLALHVVNQKEDGYHQLDMIMVPIALYDTIEIERLGEDYEATVEFDDYSIPASNSVTKAITKMREHFHFEDAFSIYIEKGIPSEAGLGGGSADAAFVMKAIVELLHLKATEEELIDIAKQVGADVPFFIKNQPCRVEGIGEKLTPISIQKNYFALLVKPFLGCSTKEIFKRFDEEKLKYSSSIEESILALKEGKDEILAYTLQNDLEAVASQFLGDIERVHRSLKEDGFSLVLMSGSGSTVFALSENKEQIQKAYDKYKQKGYYVQITSII